MKEQTLKYGEDVDQGFRLSEKKLKGYQSVRATFRLPEHLIQVLGAVASQLGVKQKSLFDQLVEDARVLSKLAENQRNLELKEQNHRRAKTFVLSRRSVEALNMVANHHNIPRDVLVETSIERLLPIVVREQERQEKRDRVVDVLADLAGQMEDLQKKALRLLGDDDQITVEIKRLMAFYRQRLTSCQEVVEGGRAIMHLDQKGVKK